MIKKLVLLPIRLYQWILSPWLGQNCRFQPTCSQYAKEAIEKWGVIKGTWLAIKRIGKCHPWGSYGFDPVPEKPLKPQ